MNGVLVVDKPKGKTSRDVVNEVVKVLNTKKVGHTGTLDPLATGVLVLCIGKATKLVDVITGSDKEYLADVKLGVLTDTLDTDGNVIEKRKCIINKDKLDTVLKLFLGKYNQEVPIYSAVRKNGKRLYEYARENKMVDLPKRMVEIKNIELLEVKEEQYKFKVTASKGTYIRSLIKDINDKLGIIGVMSDLRRIRQGDFDISDAFTLEDIKSNKHKLLSITDVLKGENCVIIDDNLFEVIKHGGIINNVYNKDLVTFMYNGKVIAIYKNYDKNKTKLKPYKMFI
jgi:tRNA pseudouridine55 synthase